MTDKQYVSGRRAERPIEIRVAMAEAVRSGVIFFKTASDGILTSDVVPSQFIISVDDTEKKTNLICTDDMRTRRILHMAAGETLGFRNLSSPLRPRRSKELDPLLRPPQLARPLHRHFSQGK